MNRPSGLTEPQYISLHRWIRKTLGQPKYCDNCETLTAKKYEWANISQQYKKDVGDWVRLCTTCHKLIFDHFNRLKTVCKSGHSYTEDNTYRYNDGRRGCRACRELYRKSYKLRTLELK